MGEVSSLSFHSITLLRGILNYIAKVTVLRWLRCVQAHRW